MARVFWAVAAFLLAVACGLEEQRANERPTGESASGVRLARSQVPRVRSPDVGDGQVAKLVRGNNEVAFELYRKQAGEGSLTFSPDSISLAFSMAYAMARGETESQMAETLNYLPQGTQHRAFNETERRMSGLGRDDGGSGEPFQLNVANSAWGQEGFPFEGAYLETLVRHYGAGLRATDFGQPQEASEKINAWVEDETEDRINDLLSPDVLTPDTRLVLANAVYSKASWLSSFEESETRDAPFTLLDGGEVAVPLMRQTSYFPYAEGDGYQAVRLPYKGDAADMLMIVPEGDHFDRVEDRLNADFFDGVQGGLHDEYVKVAMPRFDLETDLMLPQSLRALGMTEPFDAGAADFGGITREADLSISEAVHKANITVDEEGTEAAAATALMFPDSAPPPPVEVTIDRPFLFAITERETGTILFLGRVTDPK